MPSPLTPGQIQQAKDKVDELGKLTRDTEAKLRAQPGSNDRTTALQIIAEKAALAAVYQAKFAVGNISEADILDLERKITANIDWLRRIIRLLGSAIRAILKGFIDLLFDLFEELWSIIETTVAQIKARIDQFGKVRVEGQATSKLKRAGLMSGYSLPANLGTVKGEFRMVLSPLGLSGEAGPKSIRFFHVESFSVAAAHVTIGGKTLSAVSESLSPEDISMVELTSTGKLSGRVWTQFSTASIKGSDERPIQGVMEFTGTLDVVSGKGKIAARSYELVSATDLGL